MEYTVIWTPDAEQDLAAARIAAPNRNVVARMANDWKTILSPLVMLAGHRSNELCTQLL